MKEMNSLHKNDTWELSELPKKKKVIGYKWMFAKKQGKDRVVSKGYSQCVRMSTGLG